MIRKLALALAFCIATATPSFAQFFPKLEETDTRNQQELHAMEDFMDAANNDHTLKKMRTGPKEDKPLGNYFQEPCAAYKSCYSQLSLEQQAKFAYDLNEYRKTFGYNFDTLHRKKDDWKFMPYEKQSEWAQFYWLRQDPDFKNLSIFEREHFIHESLIDATTIYRIYKRKLASSADTAMYCDSAVQHVISKTP